MKVLLVGCGGISTAWFDAIGTMPTLTVVALADVQEAAAQHRKDQYHLTNAVVGTDLAALIAATKPDLVFDCTVPDARAAVVTIALEAGCHVLSEKPMASNMDDARRLREAAQGSGRVFAVMQNRRFDPRVQALRAAFKSGELGALTTLNADFYIGPHFGGFREQMDHVLLLDMAIHSFDQARCICDADPVSVYCREWNPPGSWYSHDASAVAIFEMSSGVVFTYRGSWCAEGVNTSWQCDWRAIGTRGTAVWDGELSLRAQRVREDAGFLRPLEEIPIMVNETVGQTGHAACISQFIDGLQSGHPPETVCSDNIKSLAMVFGAIERARQDRRVTVSI